MRVLICGDRAWRFPELVEQELVRLKAAHGDRLFVISGAATGADTHAAETAERLGIEQVIYPANWRGFGKAAGPIRNKRMLEEGKPDLVIAFHRYLPGSKGTKHMVGIAEKAGIPVMIVERTEVANVRKQEPAGV